MRKFESRSCRKWMGSDSQCNNDGYVKADFLVSSPDQVDGAAADVAASQVPASNEKHQMQTHLLQTDILCALDAGHQQAGISEQEPNGPGSVMKGVYYWNKRRSYWSCRASIKLRCLSNASTGAFKPWLSGCDDSYNK